MPVNTGNSTQGLGGLSGASRPGMMPIVWPPSPRAPRQAASMMPPPPPQQTVTPRFASSWPTSSASRTACAGAPSPPITDMIIARPMIPAARAGGNAASGWLQRPAVARAPCGAVGDRRDGDRGRAVQHDLSAVRGVQLQAAHVAALNDLDDEK